VPLLGRRSSRAVRSIGACNCRSGAGVALHAGRPKSNRTLPKQEPRRPGSRLREGSPSTARSKSLIERKGPLPGQQTVYHRQHEYILVWSRQTASTGITELFKVPQMQPGTYECGDTLAIVEFATLDHFLEFDPGKCLGIQNNVVSIGLRGLSFV
jgi:hypothetical protein